MPPRSVEFDLPQKKPIRWSGRACVFSLARIKRGLEFFCPSPIAIELNQRSNERANHFPQKRIRLDFKNQKPLPEQIFLEKKSRVFHIAESRDAFVARSREGRKVNFAFQNCSHFLKSFNFGISLYLPNKASRCRARNFTRQNEISIDAVRGRKSRAEIFRHFASGIYPNVVR